MASRDNKMWAQHQRLSDIMQKYIRMAQQKSHPLMTIPNGPAIYCPKLSTSPFERGLDPLQFLYHSDDRSHGFETSLKVSQTSRSLVPLRLTFAKAACRYRGRHESKAGRWADTPHGSSTGAIEQVQSQSKVDWRFDQHQQHR
jgi:hypothetical protein